MASLLQVQQPGIGSYWLDISRNDSSLPNSEFSPVYYDTGSDEIFSSTLYGSYPGVKLGAPFISTASTHSNGSGLNVDLLMCVGGEPTNKLGVSVCNNLMHITYKSWPNASRGYFSCRNLSHNLTVKESSYRIY